MPYSNIPADSPLQDKMESCVQEVMAQGKDKEAAIAICYASIVGKSTPTPPRDYIKELQDGILALFAKYGARHSKADNDAIQAVHDNAVQLGAMCVKARAYGSALTVFKEGDGWRWLGVVSNAYRDLDGENITSAAHREYVAHLDANPGEAPELWSWHTPGTARKARADWWDYTDNGFLWMSGPLTEAEAKQMQTGEPLGMSHGFKAVKQGNDIVYYRTFEVSELPITAAANPWTKIQTLQTEEKQMGFTPEKRAFLETRFGADRVKELEDAEGAQAKALTAAGVTFKAADEMAAEDKPPEPEAKQEPPEIEDAGSPAAVIGQCMEICKQCATICLQCAAVCAPLGTPEARQCAEDCMTCSKACQTCADSCATVMQSIGATAATETPQAMQMERARAQSSAATVALGEQVEKLARVLLQMQADTQSEKSARETLTAQIAALQTQITTLKQSDDEKIAKALNPRIAPAATSATAQGVTGTKASDEALALAQSLANNQFDWLKTVKIV